MVGKLGAVEGRISSEFDKESCGDFCDDFACFGS